MITSGAPDNYGHCHLRAFKQPHLQNPLCPFRLHVNTSRHTVGQALYPGSCRTQMVCPLLAQGWKMLSDRVHRLDVSRWALGSVLSSGMTGSLWVWRLKDTIHHEDPERQSGWKDYVKAGRPGSSGIQRPRISGNLTEPRPCPCFPVCQLWQSRHLGEIPILSSLHATPIPSRSHAQHPLLECAYT